MLGVAGAGLPRRRDYADELTGAFPAAQLVNAEGSVIDLPFQLPNGRPTALRVSLPPHFPQDHPVLCVVVPLQHPAVDATGRVHLRAADQWGSGSTSRRLPADLVAVVREALVLLNAADAASAAGASAAAAGVAGGKGAAQPGAGAGGGAGGDLEAFLESLSTSQLEALLCDEEALRKAAAQWLQETAAARALEDVRRQNKQLAASNLSLSRSIDEARGHVAIVRSGEYAAMRSLFEELFGRQKAVILKMGPDVLLARLRAEADQLDTDSDELLERFQSGSIGGLEAFVDAYVAAREAFHVVDLKRQAAEHHRMVPDDLLVWSREVVAAALGQGR
ncbi:hypothetical protein HYH02_011749 [Chlamydomonas schloesseri]|uniref:VPS37 C-terminal domain-containing protein n=1 Tax=Chlamydomonas schloesseri TaxID=2026947 RepID=A0A835T2W7_9CHLO|nr:hypothetical protein HYH02_011749 [Chlamydomonas schloesseri]|eukprot:KAG2436037.1 hypothetical protein HYH02_011749 [Chlamydomonas schloesseri]